MKRLILILNFLAFCSICNAQYAVVTHYESPTNAANRETQMLNNIMFDVNAFKDNPVTLSLYDEYLKKNRIYSIGRSISKASKWVGGALMVGSLVTIGQIDDNAPEEEISRLETTTGALLVSGGTLLLGGAIGKRIFNNKMKENKKLMIYYVKTTNNGVGIVTVF